MKELLHILRLLHTYPENFINQVLELVHSDYNYVDTLTTVSRLYSQGKLSRSQETSYYELANDQRFRTTEFHENLNDALQRAIFVRNEYYEERIFQLTQLTSQSGFDREIFGVQLPEKVIEQWKFGNPITFKSDQFINKAGKVFSAEIFPGITEIEMDECSFNPDPFFPVRTYKKLMGATIPVSFQEILQVPNAPTPMLIEAFEMEAYDPILQEKQSIIFSGRLMTDRSGMVRLIDRIDMGTVPKEIFGVRLSEFEQTRLKNFVGKENAIDIFVDKCLWYENISLLVWSEPLGKNSFRICTERVKSELF